MFALLIYRIILLLLLPVILLVLLFRSIRNPQYRQRLSERFGLISKPYKKNGIIVHAASVGEVIALTPLIEQLLQTYPELPITLTTFTPTGSAQVKKQFSSRVQHSFLPLDILPCTQLFLSRLQPKLMIFMETELWPNLINQCAKKQIKLLLINGRLSANSMKSYKKISPLITPTLNSFDKILCQSQDNLTNFLQLGAHNKRCMVSGNLKFDICINTTILDKKAQLTALLPENRQLWLVASTHQGDEEIALTAFKQIKALFPTLLLVLVPRHPERFNAVEKLCLSHDFTLVKRSDNNPVESQDIWLLDTLGELMAAYSLADIVTMGGSFSHIGGHNPLEPALFKKPIVVGSDMSNFTDILKQLKQLQGIVQLPVNQTSTRQASQLAKMIINLLQDKPKAELLGKQALQVVMNNQGASDRTLSQVQELMS
ncbi:lipid IV(A) 3-deoxy-D-manno-octulosonic acid transferase [Candidatus Colwellia aromaticivorans]|uniref:lipid IV(A) 3-deoxy-D-manno-octulosonic acid transferase n=1 Tax=Candidatus Colwellia aromaticivorans TaxID=2267621 RepID=UPI000DF3861A|nr:lipid IV(A) 3-deoxy-D-manno-octulosonic acid transferase [Candidatus Colwellia aromaticivorans]